MISANHKQIFDEKGYVIVDGLVPSEQLEPLRQACERIIDKARRGEWKKRRVVGNLYPPYWEEGDDIWGVQHVMHPDLDEPSFAQWYGNKNLIGVIKELLEVKHDNFQLGLFNLLVNPLHSDFSITWHRDIMIEPDIPEEEERSRLSAPHFGIQWNTALYPDDCLYVVPGSHNRVRTEEERRVHIADPFTNEMPGAICVHLDVGQTLFYNSYILHRGIYNKNAKRATLHASLALTLGSPEQVRIAAAIFEHHLEWMREERFRNSLPDNLKSFLDNLIRVADETNNM